MGLGKRIGRSERLRGLLCWLGAHYIRLVHASGRWRIEGAQAVEARWRDGQPFILAFWHGRLLMMMKIWQAGMPIHMLVSEHRDGRLIAQVAAPFGISTIAGSSTRGGAAGLRGLLRMLKGGGCVGITPDGPKGPRMRATAGIVILAKLSGCPILPATYAAAPRRLLGSWDRFVVPLPFGRGVFLWGEPLWVPRDADEDRIEQCRLQLEQALNALTDRADALMGRPPVPPA